MENSFQGRIDCPPFPFFSFLLFLFWVCSTLYFLLVVWLQNLDALHDHLATIYPGMRAPSFRCTVRPEDGALILHYYSDRPGLEHIVIGIVKVSKKTNHVPKLLCTSLVCWSGKPLKHFFFFHAGVDSSAQLQYHRIAIHHAHFLYTITWELGRILCPFNVDTIFIMLGDYPCCLSVRLEKLLE